MTTAVATKKAILDRAGYAYDFNHMLYFNRHAKKAFSVEFVDDNTPEELARRIGEPTGAQRWEFYVSYPPVPDSVRKQLEAALG
jgi:hypothetical protein